MIFLENISKSFETELFKPKKKILDKVSFQIKSQSITGFLGANGAGKSTIIKLILGFIFPDEGQITFGKELGVGKTSVFSKIGFLPERPFFYPNLTGMELLKYLGGLSGVPSNIQKDRIGYFSKRLSLHGHLQKKINSYSKGMMQRLGLIGCMIHDPILLILDEPLSGMDPLGRKDIKEMFIELNESGKTIFFSSHILADVEEICDRIVVLDNGSLKFEGSKNELIPFKNTFIVKILGKLEKINLSFLKESKYKAGVTTIEVLDSELQSFIKELDGRPIISIIRKNSSMEEIVYGTSK